MISQIYDCIVSYDGDKLNEGKFRKGVEVCIVCVVVKFSNSVFSKYRMFCGLR